MIETDLQGGPRAWIRSRKVWLGLFLAAWVGVTGYLDWVRRSQRNDLASGAEQIEALSRNLDVSQEQVTGLQAMVQSMDRQLSKKDRKIVRTVATLERKKRELENARIEKKKTTRELGLKIKKLKKEQAKKFAALEKSRLKQVLNLKRQQAKKIHSLKESHERKVGELEKEKAIRISQVRKAEAARVTALARQSEERVKALKKKHADRIAAAQKNENTQLEKIRKEQIGRLEKLQKTKTANAKELANLKQQMTDIKNSEDARIASVKRAEEEKLRRLREEQDRVLAQMKEKEAKKLAAARLKESQKLADLKEEEARKLEAIRAEQESSLAAIREEESQRLLAVKEAEAKKLSEIEREKEKAVEKLRVAEENLALKAQALEEERLAKENLTKEYGSEKERLSGEIARLSKDREDLAKQLQEAFDRAGVQAAEVDKKTGDVVIHFDDQYFGTGKSILRPGMKNILKELLPVYAESLMNNQESAGKLSGIEIIGFASPTFNNRYVDPESLSPEDQEAIKFNLDLSFARARSVFSYAFDSSRFSFNYQKDLLPLVKVSGRSFLAADTSSENRAPAGMDADEYCSLYDCKKSQRVEIKFHLKE